MVVVPYGFVAFDCVRNFYTVCNCFQWNRSAPIQDSIAHGNNHTIQLRPHTVVCLHGSMMSLIMQAKFMQKNEIKGPASTIF